MYLPDERKARNKARRQELGMGLEQQRMGPGQQTVRRPGMAQRQSPTQAPTRATAPGGMGTAQNKPVFRSRNAPGGPSGMAGGAPTIGQGQPNLGGPQQPTGTSQANYATVSPQQGGQTANVGGQGIRGTSGPGSVFTNRYMADPSSTAGWGQLTGTIRDVDAGDPLTGPGGMTGPGAPGGDGDGGPAADDEAGWGQTNQDLWEELFREMLLAGPRDTAEEEEQIRQQMLAGVSDATRDARGQMAAAGFGASGALASLQGDINRRAEMDAMDQMLGIRQGARDEFQSNLMDAIAALQGQQKLDIQQDVADLGLEMFQDYLDLPEDDALTGSGPGGVPLTPEEQDQFWLDSGIGAGYGATLGTIDTALGTGTWVQSRDELPEDATLEPGLSGAGIEVYTTPDGQVYRIWVGDDDGEG